MAKKYEIISMARYSGNETQHLYFEIKGNTAMPINSINGLTKEVLAQSEKHEKLIKLNPELLTIKSRI